MWTNCSRCAVCYYINLFDGDTNSLGATANLYVQDVKLLLTVPIAPHCPRCLVGIPESAFIDGANDIQIFMKIVLPLSLPVIATMILVYSVGHWNSFFSALIYINEKKKMPLQIHLYLNIFMIRPV